MVGKSTHGCRHLSETEKAGNESIDAKPPNQTIDARETLAAGKRRRATQDSAVVEERKAATMQAI
jgi:hypothetical protein